MRTPALALLILLPLAAAAAEPPDLPPAAQASAAITSHPDVLAARAAVAAARAQQRALEAGPYETQLRFGAARRRDRALARDLTEYELGIERPLRIGDKSRLDREIGEQSVARARLAVEDAIHETARGLLRMWFAWMRARAESGDWADQTALLERQLASVDRRVRLGDAPRQERLLAQAALAQAETSQLQAGLRADVARAELTRGFPALRLPAELPQAEVPPLGHDLGWWRERMLEHNHALAMARAEQRRLRLLTARADADRTPDPTLGLRYASERDDSERVIGLVLSVPFSGAARSAAADEALAQADAAAQREAALRRRVEAEAAALYAGAAAAHEAAQRAALAAEGMRRNSELAGRAYALGESNLADVLLAQRYAIEARLAATLARLGAAESRYRLLIDAGELWPPEPARPD
jgi:outer membrane protein TolC